MRLSATSKSDDRSGSEPRRPKPPVCAARADGRNRHFVLVSGLQEPAHTTTFDGSHVWVVTVFGRHGGIGWTGSPAIGGAWTTGTSQTQLSAIAAPPPKKSYRNGLLLLFLSPLLAAIVAE